jgi:hypothetical protein
MRRLGAASACALARSGSTFLCEEVRARTGRPPCGTLSGASAAAPRASCAGGRRECRAHPSNQPARRAGYALCPAVKLLLIYRPTHMSILFPSPFAAHMLHFCRAAAPLTPTSPIPSSSLYSRPRIAVQYLRIYRVHDQYILRSLWSTSDETQ